MPLSPNWHRPLMRLVRSTAFASLWAVLSSTHAQMTAFPNRPVTLVSPFAAGGTSDAVARALARQMEVELKQPVVVLNRPGAGGTLGIASVTSAAADGYTLAMGGLGSVVFPAVVYKGRIKYDAARDLVPVGVVGSAPTLVVARADLPAKTLPELVSLARSQPGKLTFASAGTGGTLHVAGVLLEREAGISLNHVPYKGGAPAMTDLAGGNVDIALADLTLAQPFLQGGRVRPLAVASAQRAVSLPDVPTTAEVGLKNVRMDTWYGVFAPSGVPAAILQRLEAAVEGARSTPVFVQALQAQSITPVSTPSAEFRSALKRDFESWLPLLSRICSDTGCD